MLKKKKREKAAADDSCELQHASAFLAFIIYIFISFIVSLVLVLLGGGVIYPNNFNKH